MRKLFVFALVILLSMPALSGCGGSDEGDPPSFSERMIDILTLLKGSAVNYNEVEKSDVKPYLEKTIISIDEAIGLLRNYQSDEEIPDEFLNEISAVVIRASESVREASLRSDAKDDRYELLVKALNYVADRLVIT
ncbi:MAG: hypothetical protein KDC73_03865 [Ignavibacteriae bacterium]|nr:hypothetical protein [Ignavibacteriota bacterium]MCB0723813.1 hypothetical protein [Ignavibacteriota bacterium]MCB9244142.1 hypothetical protein [Ignavibacteriales bacterium]